MVLFYKNYYFLNFITVKNYFRGICTKRQEETVQSNLRATLA